MPSMSVMRQSPLAGEASVRLAKVAKTYESRGAQVRIDHPEMDPSQAANLVADSSGGQLRLRWAPVVTVAEEVTA